MIALLRWPPRRWTVAEIRAAARTLVLAAAVELGVRVIPLDRLARWFGVRLATGSQRERRAPAVGPPGAVHADVWDGALDAKGAKGADVAFDAPERAACRAVARVMRRWPGTSGTCLREALLYGHALRGRNPRLHVGAGPAGDRVVAHAWLSFDGGALGRRAGLLELTSDGR